MENERRYRRRNSDVKEENMESSEQEPRTVRHEYGSSSAGDSIGQARRVIDELEARINDARRVPMSKTLSIIDTGELIDLIGQLRIVLPHTVVQAQAILDEKEDSRRGERGSESIDGQSGRLLHRKGGKRQTL